MGWGCGCSRACCWWRHRRWALSRSAGCSPCCCPHPEPVCRPKSWHGAARTFATCWSRSGRCRRRVRHRPQTDFSGAARCRGRGSGGAAAGGRRCAAGPGSAGLARGGAAVRDEPHRHRVDGGGRVPAERPGAAPHLQRTTITDPGLTGGRGGTRGGVARSSSPSSSH